jgi:hypothetical protein
MTSRATGDFMFEVVKENNRNRQSACLFSLHADSGFEVQMPHDSPTTPRPAITTRTVAYVDRRGAHAGAGTTAARSRCSQAEEDLLRMPRHPQAAR